MVEVIVLCLPRRFPHHQNYPLQEILMRTVTANHGAVIYPMNMEACVVTKTQNIMHQAAVIVTLLVVTTAMENTKLLSFFHQNVNTRVNHPVLITTLSKLVVMPIVVWLNPNKDGTARGLGATRGGIARPTTVVQVLDRVRNVYFGNVKSIATVQRENVATKSKT